MSQTLAELEAALAAKTHDIRSVIPHENRQYEKYRALSNLNVHANHYPAGPKLADGWNTAQIVDYLIGLARFHINKLWGPGGTPPHGFSIMYHWAIGRNGERFLMQDERLVTWNCTDGNFVALATLVLAGVGQDLTAPQKQTLLEHDLWVTLRKDNPIERRNTWGHGECGGIYGGGPAWHNSTDCPGKVLPIVRQFREGGGPTPVPANNDPWTNPDVPFPTGYYVRGDIGIKYRSIPQRDALYYWGYPITNELQIIDENGAPRTAQVFERAVAEWHPEQTDPYYKVQLKRLGAEYLHNLGTPVGVTGTH